MHGSPVPATKTLHCPCSGEECLQVHPMLPQIRVVWQGSVSFFRLQVTKITLVLWLPVWLLTGPQIRVDKSRLAMSWYVELLLNSKTLTATCSVGLRTDLQRHSILNNIYSMLQHRRRIVVLSFLMAPRCFVFDPTVDCFPSQVARGQGLA